MTEATGKEIHPGSPLHLQLHHFENLLFDIIQINEFAVQKGLSINDLFAEAGQSFLSEFAGKIAERDAEFWGNAANPNYSPATPSDAIKHSSYLAQNDNNATVAINKASEIVGPMAINKEQYRLARQQNLIMRFSVQDSEFITLDHLPDGTCLFETQITPPDEPAPHCLIDIPKLLEKGKTVNLNSIWYLAFSEFTQEHGELNNLIIIEEDSVKVKGSILRNTELLNTLQQKKNEVLKRYSQPKRALLY